MATATLPRTVGTLSADEVEQDRVRLNGHRLFEKALEEFGESHRKNAKRPLRLDASDKHVQHVAWLCRAIRRTIARLERPQLAERPTAPNPTWVPPISPRVPDAVIASPVAEPEVANALPIAPGSDKHRRPAARVTLTRTWEAVEQHRTGFLAKHGPKLSAMQRAALDFQLTADSDADDVSEVNRQIHRVSSELAAERRNASAPIEAVAIPAKPTNNGWTNPRGGTVNWDKQASIPDRPAKATTPAKVDKKKSGGRGGKAKAQ